MGNIKVLNLSDNSITGLNQKSREIISSSISPNLSVILDGNPLSCAVCEDYEFIQWLLLDSTPVHNRRKLTCRTKHREKEQITNMTIKKLKDMCDAPLKHRQCIITLSVVPASLLLAVVFVVLTLYQCVKRRSKKRRLEEAKRKLQRGYGPYTYAMFLYFCDNDADIVNRHVTPNLEDALHRRLATQRKFVTTSADIEPGRSILDEIEQHLELSSLVAFVLSDAFLISRYSTMETLPAKHKDKPFLFFVNGQINESSILLG
ncbi:hypothetical protein DPMN_174911 [Dreissena polymorpha]|uniref:TIR domain-containing protein n=1 Tax=Dreissena polymorpha TaxID=45954 RepID=A0A9D4E781_DREPO|nr:hypothetical protein DPMN_174911 [Dreissena polymorpha]